MLELFIGGSGSGKSEYAESEALRLFKENFSKGSLIYLATMENSGDGAAQRIRRHRERRKSKGFETVEMSRGIGALTERRFNEHGKPTVLLEALSNLLANELFSAGLSYDPSVSERILDDIGKLEAYCGNLIIVSDDVFRDGCTYGDETEEYMRTLGFLHRSIALSADRVIEVTAGSAVPWKG